MTGQAFLSRRTGASYLSSSTQPLCRIDNAFRGWDLRPALLRPDMAPWQVKEIVGNGAVAAVFAGIACSLNLLLFIELRPEELD